MYEISIVIYWMKRKPTLLTMSTPITMVRTQLLPKALSTSNNITVIDQNDEEQSYANAVDHLVRKLDRRLLLFLVVLEISSAINLVSIGTYFDLNDSTLKTLL